MTRDSTLPTIRSRTTSRFRFDRFWALGAIGAGVCFLIPGLGLLKDGEPLDVVLAAALGSGIRFVLFLQWGRAPWARKLAAGLRGGGAQSVYLVWANALGSTATGTAVAVLDEAAVTFHYRHRVAHIDPASMTEIRLSRRGGLKPDTVVIDTADLGVIELTPLIANGGFPSGDAESSARRGSGRCGAGRR